MLGQSPERCPAIAGAAWRVFVVVWPFEFEPADAPLATAEAPSNDSSQSD